ncbi:MAG: hypothetical protein CM15mP83_6910 [Flavobacteriaceae bacterium]|nr:MAG: hypothetical protein CM15mP83_6910 [Flavobacteriaceae bacterium]
MKNVKNIDDDLFDNENPNQDYTIYPIDQNPEFEITKYLMIEQEQNPVIQETIEVTVVGGSFVYTINGVQTSSLNFERGKTYRFTQEDSSNLGYLLKFSENEDGSEYDYLVTYAGTAGNPNSYTQITVIL